MDIDLYAERNGERAFHCYRFGIGTTDNLRASQSRGAGVAARKPAAIPAGSSILWIVVGSSRL